MSAYVVTGLILGSLYAISSIGLVLTYKTTRVFNLAHGAIAYVVAELYYELVQESGWAIVPAAVVCLGIFAPLLGLTLWWTVFRRLTNAPAVVKLVSTIGLLVALPALARMVFAHGQIFSAPGLAPTPVGVVDVFGVAINGNEIAVLAAALVTGLGLAAMLRWTSIGLAMRAVVDSPTVALLTGTRASAVGACAWVLGSVLAGLAGILLAPILNLTAGSYTELVVASISVAVAARLTSLPRACFISLGLGLSQALLVGWAPAGSIWATGLRPALPLVLLLVALLLVRVDDDDHPDHAAVITAPEAPPVRGDVRRRRGRAWAAGGCLVAAGILVPLLLTPYWTGVVALGMAFAVIFLSLTFVVGEAGIVSLGQAAFVGLGGFMAARLIAENGVPFGVAAVLGGVASAAAAVVVGWPALRLGTLPLALATLAFALFADTFLFKVTWLVPSLDGVSFARPELGDLSDDRNYLYLTLIVFALLAALLSRLHRGVTGLYMGALRGNAIGAASLGISPLLVRLTAFAIGGFIAGVGGTILGSYQLSLGLVDVSAVTGLVWLAIVVTWGIATPLGALLGGLATALVPALLVELSLPDRWGELPAVLFGLGAIALAADPRGVVAATATALREATAHVAPRGRELAPASGSAEAR